MKESSSKLDEHEVEDKHEADEVTNAPTRDPFEKEDMKVPVHSKYVHVFEESSLKLDEHEVEDKHEADEVTTKSTHVTPLEKKI